MTTPSRPGGMRPWLRWTVAAVCLLLFVVSGLMMRLPYFITVPGVTRDTARLVRTPGGPVSTNGRLLLVTVGAQPTNAWLYMYGKLNPLADLRTREQMLGPDRTYEEYNEENERLMTDSQHTAKQAALAFVGIAGDDRGAELDVAISNISGPSAGLVFALELIQQLLDEDLTQGHVVAVTGTVAADGTVGIIGGIRQKVMAAERSGADTMLVPEENAAAARAAARHLRIVPVRTVQEAVAALRSLK